ncbi:LLM class flavin-dependent oxidoreductase [bacterium]|nr:LLM class flavin-dependent oxidoreductase [bacterium]
MVEDLHEKQVVISDIRNEIRSYMVAKGQTYKSVAELLKNKYGENVTAQSLNNKLARGSLRYIDAKQIADVLGYKIRWEG